MFVVFVFYWLVCQRGTLVFHLVEVGMDLLGLDPLVAVVLPKMYWYFLGREGLLSGQVLC